MTNRKPLNYLNLSEKVAIVKLMEEEMEFKNKEAVCKFINDNLHTNCTVHNLSSIVKELGWGRWIVVSKSQGESRRRYDSLVKRVNELESRVNKLEALANHARIN